MRRAQIGLGFSTLNLKELLDGVLQDRGVERRDERLEVKVIRSKKRCDQDNKGDSWMELFFNPIYRVG